MKLILIKLILVFILTGLYFACIEEPGRDNPLDPANGNSLLQISGQVLTFYHPRKAISGASVFVQPGDYIVLSDENGYFRFNNLEPGDYTLVCQADGYQIDSSAISIKSSIEHNFLLDGLPRFEKISIEAHHRSRWFPLEEIYFIEVEAVVSDPDGIGDIRSVICQIPSMGYTDTLQAGIESGKFSSTLFDPDLPVSSIHQLIGRHIYFVVEDDFGTTNTSEAKFLTRIIEDTPQLISPAELQSIESLPINFQWERISVPYPATLHIEIFQINLGIAFKSDEVENIEADRKSFQYSKNLNTGDYFWTISIVDEFGNSSSSREGTFKIK